MALSSSAAEVFRKKFSLVVLNFDKKDNQVAKLLPDLNKEITRIRMSKERIGFPCIFLMDPTAKKNYGMVAMDKRDLKGCLRNARKLEKEAIANAVEAESEDEATFEKWQNSEGKTIEAKVLSQEGDKVLLQLRNGKKVNYAIEKLSKESQERLKKLAAEKS